MNIREMLLIFIMLPPAAPQGALLPTPLGRDCTFYLLALL